MGDTFLISDTHFGHSNIIQFEAAARPFATIEEMNEALIANWNKVVGHNDTVWHLGDVLFGQKNFYLLDRLNGRKNLVLGNHDVYGLPKYLEKFRDVQAYKKFDDCIFSHIPVHEGQFGRYRANIHGHLHSKVVTKVSKFDTGIGEMSEYHADRRYFNVSVEKIDLTPIAWEVVKKQLI